MPSPSTFPTSAEPAAPLPAELLALYRERGHVTVPGLLSEAQAQALVDDIHAVGERFLGKLPPDERTWYIFKPPEGGGPKPAHQDNFYFGPNGREGLVTAWVALHYVNDGTRFVDPALPDDETLRLRVS